MHVPSVQTKDLLIRNKETDFYVKEMATNGLLALGECTNAKDLKA